MRPSARFPLRAQHARSFASRGFTLVELLAVLGIIGILAVIAIPVIGGVHRKAHASQCLSNVRQLVQFFLIYANDHDGKLPAWELAGQADENRAFRTLYRDGYVRDPALFVCPVNKAAGRTALGPTIIGDRYPCYYSSNQSVVPRWGPSAGKKFARPSRVSDEGASRIPVVFDQRANADAASAVNQHRPSASVPGGVFGYLDGSVVYITAPNDIIRSP